MITFDDFSHLELKIGIIHEAIKVEGSEKLMQLQVKIGEDEPRQIVAGIAKQYQPDELVGQQIVVLANLEPKKMMGLESQGMLLAANDDGKPVLLQPKTEVSVGTKVS